LQPLALVEFLFLFLQALAWLQCEPTLVQK